MGKNPEPVLFVVYFIVCSFINPNLPEPRPFSVGKGVDFQSYTAYTNHNPKSYTAYTNPNPNPKSYTA